MLFTIEQNIDRVACKVPSLYKHSFTAHCVNQLCCSTHIVFRLNVHPGDFLRLGNIRCQHVGERQNFRFECLNRLRSHQRRSVFRIHHRVNNDVLRTVFAQLFRHSRHHLRRRQHANLHGVRTDIFIDCVHLRADNLRRNILLFQHMHGVFSHDGYDHAHRVHAVCGYCLDIRLNTRAAGAIRPGDGQYALHCTHHSESSETVRFCTSTGSSAWIVNVGFVSSSTCAMTVFATPLK